MEFVYDSLFIIYREDRTASDIIAFSRRIERRIIWTLSELGTALFIMYFFYKIGIKAKNERLMLREGLMLSN